MLIELKFSINDFIVVLKFIDIVIDVFRNSKEVGLTYRELVRELYSLKTVLLYVKHLNEKEIL